MNYFYRLRNGVSEIVFPYGLANAELPKELLNAVLTFSNRRSLAALESHLEGREVYEDTADLRRIFNSYHDRLSKQDRNRLRRRSRHADESAVGGRLSKCDRMKIWEIQGGMCYFTGDSLSEDAGGFEIDHLTPISKGGSFWPGNMVYARKFVNQEKGSLDRDEYFDMLAERNGRKWVDRRRKICKEQDAMRLHIEKEAKNILEEQVKGISHQLRQEFSVGYIDISYDRDNDSLSLYAAGATIILPRGLVRQPKKFQSTSTYTEIARVLLQTL